jgi:hypothetical protein
MPLGKSVFTKRRDFHRALSVDTELLMQATFSLNEIATMQTLSEAWALDCCASVPCQEHGDERVDRPKPSVTLHASGRIVVLPVHVTRSCAAITP